MSDDLAFMPAADIAQRVRTKQLSAVEVTRACLARIAALNPTLNCSPFRRLGTGMNYRPVLFERLGDG